MWRNFSSPKTKYTLIAVLPFMIGMAVFFYLRGSALTITSFADFIQKSAEQKALEESIKATLASHQDGDLIELAELTPFSWDKVYIFGEYTSSDVINKTIGFEWLAFKGNVSELNDLLVFVRRQQVVQYVMLSGDVFAPALDGNIFPIEEAIFTLREVGEEESRKKILR
jgi:hypothetical protein